MTNEPKPSNFFFSITYFKFLQIQIIKRSDIVTTIYTSICYGIIMSYTVSYYVGTDRDCQIDFTDFKSAYEYARKQWESLDKLTRENYVNNGWQTCIVCYDADGFETDIIGFE